MPHLEITETILAYCNIVNNAPNKSFGQLPDISPKNLTFLKTFYSEFPYIKVWFTDQTSKPLETEDKINITLLTVCSYHATYAFQSEPTLYSCLSRSSLLKTGAKYEV